MSKTITPENLLLYVYDEIEDSAKIVEIQSCLKEDKEMMHEYKRLKSMKFSINTSIEQSFDLLIKKLVNYSKVHGTLATEDKGLRLMNCN